LPPIVRGASATSQSRCLVAPFSPKGRYLPRKRLYQASNVSTRRSCSRAERIRSNSAWHATLTSKTSAREKRGNVTMHPRLATSPIAAPPTPPSPSYSPILSVSYTSRTKTAPATTRHTRVSHVLYSPGRRIGAIQQTKREKRARVREHPEGQRHAHRSLYFLYVLLRRGRDRSGQVQVG
jgi:hypothetical protein